MSSRAWVGYRNLREVGVDRHVRGPEPREARSGVDADVACAVIAKWHARGQGRWLMMRPRGLQFQVVRSGRDGQADVAGSADASGPIPDPQTLPALAYTGIFVLPADDAPEVDAPDLWSTVAKAERLEESSSRWTSRLRYHFTSPDGVPALDVCTCRRRSPARAGHPVDWSETARRLRGHERVSSTSVVLSPPLKMLTLCRAASRWQR